MAAGALPALRDRVRRALDRMRRLVRARGVVAGLALAVGPAILWRLRVHLLAVHRHPGGRAPDGDAEASSPVEKVTDRSGLSEADLAILREHGGDALVARFDHRFSHGDWVAIGRVDGALASFCWVHEVSSYVPGGGARVAFLQSAFTLPHFRGGGLFPRTLAFAVRCVERARPGMPIYIEAAIDNLSSRRGIEKAGFLRVGLRVTTPLGQRWFPARIHEGT
jgi:GNAT superfamily N-acetyltransferase